jgi:metallo-beta-lactamase class B
MTRAALRLLPLAIALACAAGIASAAPAVWTQDQKPFRIYGDTYYVGSHGLGSILVVSSEGDVLIDGDLPESVPKIAANIRALGFRVEDVKLILNTHVHFDHAGGIAELQRMSGARVAASEPSAKVLREGGIARDDPQYGSIPGIAAVANVETVKDGDTVRVGPIALTAHVTPGHTAGGTTWTWKSCEKDRCLDIVYADSLSPIAAKGFLFSDTAHAGTLAGFAKSFETLKSLPCDILVTPHPEVSDLWNRLARREQGDADALVDSSACARLADTARNQLDARIDGERGGRVH